MDKLKKIIYYIFFAQSLLFVFLGALFVLFIEKLHIYMYDSDKIIFNVSVISVLFVLSLYLSSKMIKLYYTGSMKNKIITSVILIFLFLGNFYYLNSYLDNNESITIANKIISEESVSDAFLSKDKFEEFQKHVKGINEDSYYYERFNDILFLQMYLDAHNKDLAESLLRKSYVKSKKREEYEKRVEGFVLTKEIIDKYDIEIKNAYLEFDEQQSSQMLLNMKTIKVLSFNRIEKIKALINNDWETYLKNRKITTNE